ncbi:MAG: acyltransferase [Bdellovibrionales bacterium]
MRYYALDAWRGVFALFIMLTHLGVAWHGYSTGFIRSTYLFVDYYFVLSGFVISTAYASKISNYSDFWSFIVKRIGRIYPLHIFMLAVFVGLELVKLLAAYYGHSPRNAPFSGDTSIQSLITNILLIHSLGIHHILTWNYPSWCVSTEFFAYIIFAVVVLFIRPISEKLSLLSFFALMLLGLFIIISFSPLNQDTTYDYGFFRCLADFTCGILIYSFTKKHPIRFGHFRNLAEFGIIAIVVAFVTLAGRSKASYAAPMIFSLMIIVFYRQEGFLSKILSSSFFQKLGDWSYSIYMIHAFFIINITERPIHIIEKYFGISLSKEVVLPDSTDLMPNTSVITDLGGLYQGDLLVLAVVVACVLTARQTYRWIEIPGRNYLIRKFGTSSIQNSVSPVPAKIE